MNLKITFTPLAPQTPDLFLRVREDGLDDARTIAKTTAAENFPITLGYAIHNASGDVIERWDHDDGFWQTRRQ